MSPSHPPSVLYSPSWSPTSDIRSLCASSNPAYGQMKSRYGSFDAVPSANLLAKFQYSYPLLPEVPAQPVRPLMAAHFVDGRKAVWSRMQRKLEDHRGPAHIRDRGWNARFCVCLSLRPVLRLIPRNRCRFPRLPRQWQRTASPSM